MTDCKHEAFATHAAVQFLEDVGQWFVDFSITCQQCGIPFHFITPDYGLRRDRPAASPTAVELRCPIAPGEGVIPAGPMRFEIPSRKPRES